MLSKSPVLLCPIANWKLSLFLRDTDAQSKPPGMQQQTGLGHKGCQSGLPRSRVQPGTPDLTAFLRTADAAGAWEWGGS